METIKTFRRTPPATNSAVRNPQSAIRNCNAFTLIELMVTIAIIILVAATAMPTITGLFSAGANEQAYNVLTAQCAAARALAITKGTYAGVHVQMADNTEYYASSTLSRCYTAIVWDNPATAVHTFDLADGYQPQPLPGTMAFGQVSDTYINGGAYDDGALKPENSKDTNDWPGKFPGFTTFTIVFNPQGEVVTNVDGGTVSFGYGSGNTDLMMDDDDEFDDPGDDVRLWRTPDSENGVLAVTLFDYKILNAKVNADTTGDAAADYLDEYGQFLALNLYTGQFFHRE